tara:strand:+ start:276 stop:488 length:213 start_codon:yes stop_codon:yes gene_type:complete
MERGDLVRYATTDIEIQIGDYPRNVQRWHNEGLLVSFDKVQRMCEILDNKTGKIVRKHCSDVQVVRIGRV